jgi:two-component system, NarL family, nitrate/nitrite response regulator NarL
METSRTMSTKVRVLVADSTRIHTQLLSDILERDPDLQVISWDCDRSTLVPTALAHDLDVLAVSSTLCSNGRDGVNVVREVCAAKPQTKVVVLLDSHRDELVLDSLRAGARGIFSKESSLDMLRKCLHSVHRGEVWVDSRGMSLAINALASAPSAPLLKAKGLHKLSKREYQVVEWLVRGLSNREISNRMTLSPHTIKNYIFRIFDKMGVSSRVELLFLILSQNNGNNGEEAELSSRTGLLDDRTISKLIEEAEKGSPTAELALAQAYALRRENPGNILSAYKWYLIVSERIAQAQSVLAETMTAKQLEESEREASFWLARMKHARAEEVNFRARFGKGSLLAS